MIRLTLAIVGRELMLSWRRRAVAIGGLMFFVIASSLFALALGPDPKLLHAVAPGVVWVTALFAAMLSTGQLFGHDYSSGALEQMLLSPQPLALIVLGKVLAHWLTSGFALTLLVPVVALQYDLDFTAVLPLMGSLLLGTPLLSLLGAIGAALTLGVRGGGVMLGLLVLPLDVPVLIFGAGAANAAADPAWASANFSLLAAALCLGVWLCPWASAAALRIAME
ncbi:heme exporter protein CcmB [Paraburkholderia dinghuensis]|uniref:Heme exporter protein B n=1 Tax=Paraburkholderia dinghuensis TaxID=2305225 RepID=A0A3N6MZM7_9BURK|nr:heme exporter protein CcmB [Paraburkholderia dinghuensis]RQH03631.1 heme exporter protein CcmB [Paraburkholderia dinghuensis]